MRELAEAVGISFDQVHFFCIMNCTCKNGAHDLLTHLLTLEQKRNRMRTSAEFSHLFKKNSSDFLRRFVIMEETWIHHYTPEMEQESK